MKRYDNKIPSEVIEEIIFKKKINWSDSLGIERFQNIDISTLKSLKEIGCLDLGDRQNNSPTAGEFMKFMEKHPNVKCHGYMVSPFRRDYRITLEGLECYENIADVKEDFEQFRDADEYKT